MTAEPTAARGPAHAPVVVLDGVSKAYAVGAVTVSALSDVTLAVPPGDLVALVGRSGSGKSTLLGLLCEWEEPDAGAIHWGADLGPVDRRCWDRIAMVPQTLGLLPELTIGENVALPIRLAPRAAADRREAHERVAVLLDDLGLAGLAGRKPHEASLGQQQRAAVARALVLRPRLLLVDEPTSHLDDDWSARVVELLHGAASEGTSCVVATHDPAVAAVADRTVRLEGGLVVDDRAAVEGGGGTAD